MSYHFQPQADSSDEEGVDLSAWKDGAKSNQSSSKTQAPIAPMQSFQEASTEEDVTKFMDVANGIAAKMGEEADDDDDDDDEGEDGNGAIGSRRMSLDVQDSDIEEVAATARPHERVRKQTERTVSSGFTAINAPSQRTSRSRDEEEVVEQGPARILREVVPRLVPLPLDSEELAEFEDFTSGGDVVRKVLRDLDPAGGQLQYEVEFEDLHVEKVSLIAWMHSVRVAL